MSQTTPDRTRASNRPSDRETPSPLPLPIIPTRKRSYDSTLDTIVRDFAYDPGDERFHKPAEQIDTLDVESEGAQEASGFAGAPPWLQSSAHNGLVSEEDLTTASADELHGRAVALFDFEPEHENEFALQEGQVIYISSRHGQGWLVAVDIHSGDCGLVPEEYVRMLEEHDVGFVMEEPSQTHSKDDKDDWEDEADDNENNDVEQRTMSDAERQKIMMQAERDMAIAEHKNMDAEI